MRKNHEQVETLIRQTISACSYDFTLSETKALLRAALQAVLAVGKKRSRNIATQKAFEDGKKKHWEWWKELQKNAAKNVDLGWFDLET